MVAFITASLLALFTANLLVLLVFTANLFALFAYWSPLCPAWDVLSIRFPRAMGGGGGCSQGLRHTRRNLSETLLNQTEIRLYLPWETHRQRKLFRTLLNRTQIRLYLPCTDWFGTANGRVRLLFQINLKIVNTIWFRFN